MAKKSGVIADREETLLDVVDSLIDKGVALDAEVVLGLADIDLIYLRAGALLAAADRVLDTPPERRRKRPRRGLVSNPRTPDARHLGGGTTVTSAARTTPPQTLEARHDARTATHDPPRTSAPADTDTSRSVIKLVLTLVDFVRQLLERQAVRRVKSGSLDAAAIERLGTALMQLEQTVHRMAREHDIDPSDLTLEVGPLGRLK